MKFRDEHPDADPEKAARKLIAAERSHRWGALKKRDRRPARCGRRTVANKEDTRQQRQDFSLQN
jgi:hypothetical protein